MQLEDIGQEGWILMFFGFFLINSSSRLHCCCQSDDRYAESTYKIVVPKHIQQGRNFRRFEAGRKYKVMVEITCDPKTLECLK